MGARACVARVVAMPIGTLAPLRASETLALLAPALALEREVAAECEALSAELYRLAGAHDDGARDATVRNALLALRRDVYHRRVPSDVGPASTLPPPLRTRLHRLARRIADQVRATERLDLAFRRDRERAERLLADLTRAPLFEEALRLVSASLLGKVRRAAGLEPAEWKHRDRQALSKALAYLGRFATKTSPNGLFCATARATFGRAGIQGTNAFGPLQVRIGVGEARKVTACLAVDQALEPMIVPRPNPTLRHEGGRFVFWKPASPRHADDDEVLSQAPDHPLLAAFLEEAGRGVHDVPHLVAAAAGRLPGGAPLEAVTGFYRKLVQHGLLIAEVEIPWSSWRPLADLARSGRDAGLEPPWLAEVEAIEREVDRLPALESGARLTALDQLERRIEALPRARAASSDDLFRVDAGTRLEVTLPDSIPRELSRFASLYAGFYSSLYPARLFRESYVRRFLAAHAADTDVDALALYHGVFEDTAPRSHAAFPELENARAPSPDRTAARRAFVEWREWFASRARSAAGEEEVALDPGELEAMVGDNEPRWACGVLFQLAATSPEALNAGEWLACVNAIYPGGGLSVSRLAALHGGWVTDELAEGLRWLERPGAVLAEVSFMHGGRTANAGLRPPLLRYEIELPGDRATPGREPIPLSDLVVRYESSSGEFRLRSRSRGVEVVPVISSGISSEGFVSFLVEIGRQGSQPLAYFPGFDADVIECWPRFRIGRVVLFRRRWRVEAGELPRPGAGGLDARGFLAVARLRERLGAPRHVFAHTSAEQKPLLVDVVSPLFVEQFLRSFPAGGGARARQLHLTEMLPSPEGLWVSDERGRYASEFLLHLAHPEVAATAADAGHELARR